MPSLSIQEGTITMNKETTLLGGGNLWLDRQSINQQSLHGHSTSGTPGSQHQLYTGNWLAVGMNDQTHYMHASVLLAKETESVDRQDRTSIPCMCIPLVK